MHIDHVYLKKRKIYSSYSLQVWVFCGLGSRGLVYHALVGEWVAGAVLRGGEAALRELPREITDWDWEEEMGGLQGAGGSRGRGVEG